MQTTRGEPDSESVVHQHLHPIGPSVGKQVRVMRVSRAKHLDHPGKRRVSSRTHVHRFGGKPDSLDTDHLSHSLSHAPQEDASLAGQVTVTVLLPFQTSTRIAGCSVCGEIGAEWTDDDNVSEDGSGSGSGSDRSVTGRKAGFECNPCDSCSRNQRCTMFALTWWRMATPAIEARSSPHS